MTLKIDMIGGNCPVQAEGGDKAVDERDPRINPMPGDVLRSCYVGQNGIDDRKVVSVGIYIRYQTTTATGKIILRECFPHTWAKWCRSHSASVVQQ